MNRLVHLFVLVVLGTSLLAGGCAAAPSGSGDSEESAPEAEYEWRVSNFLPEAGVGSQSIRHFVAVLNGLSEGRIHATYYGSAVIGDSEENFDSCTAGELEIGVISPYSKFHELQNVKGLPFAGSTWDAVDTLFYGDGIIRKIINDSWEAVGLKQLGAIENSHMVYINDVRPIQKPEDFEGLKIRVPPSDIYIKTFERMAPTGIGEAIPWTEVYTSLERGVVDGSVNFISVFESGKFCEVCKYYTDINQMYNWDDMLINLELYNSLPSDLQDIVMEASQVMENDCRFANRSSHKDIIARTQAGGVEYVFLTQEQRQVFVDLVKPLELYEEAYDDLLEKYYPGENMFDTMVDEVKKAEGW